MGMEGVMAKKADSIYLPGERTRDWLKLKVNKRHEVVIGGFTRNEDSPKRFSALLVGVYDGKRLHYTGKIGTGFNDKMQQEMMQRFKPLITTKCPFTELPDVNKPSRFRPNPPHATVTWLRPKLVGEVSYAEITSDGLMRHPRLPRFTSIERLTQNRKGKIYIDYLQNRPKATLAAAYSLRPKPGATLPMPLDWSEVKKGLELLDFTMLNAIQRVKSTGDLFKPVLGKVANIAKALRQLE